MKSGNVSQADWKFKIALRSRYLQDRHLDHKNAHKQTVPEKGRDLASVNRGSQQVADMKGKRPINAGARASERPAPDGVSARPPAQADAASEAEPLGDTDVGNALRSVYQQTVDETIPPEMMDLLKKLT